MFEEFDYNTASKKSRRRSDEDFEMGLSEEDPFEKDSYFSDGWDLNFSDDEDAELM